MIKKYGSILSADASNYGEAIKKIEDMKFDGLHFDIMDGHFVKNFAFNAHVISSLRKITQLAFGTHLEIENPGEYIEMFIDAGSDIITFHPQASSSVERDLRLIRARGALSSIAIDPDIKAFQFEKYFPLVDNIIVMSVYPGFGEQRFISSSLKKIKKIKESITSRGLDISISIDGSINEETAGPAVDSGADTLIYGSSIFKNKET